MGESSEEGTFELRPEKNVTWVPWVCLPLFLELPAQAQLPQGGVRAEERLSVSGLGLQWKVGCSCFYQLSVHSADPSTGPSFQDGGGTHTGNSVTEGQMAVENDMRGLPHSLGDTTLGNKSQCIWFPAWLYFFALPLPLRKKINK